MAEIPIRSYLHDIEKHIESGRTDQAISHSRYILQYYPKYVDAYRLLGKAYLESQRYTDAGDIFQRVLSSVPDDFVSHAGMSIIREDEGNLDEAIWHMERAFEVQPSNNAIQEELRRLYSKRDNVEPPKIRLTRGALARLYYKGELYQQAIGEIRVALGESPTRLDLQALLADIYIKTSQRVEAADTALAVLRRLPNCMIAIRVMIRVLVGADREPEQKSYRQRLAQLDPYSAFTTPEDPNSEAVQDEAVRMEKLDWKPDQVMTDASTPAWAASLGVDLADLAPSSESTLPDWLEDLSSQTSQEEFAADSSSAAFPFGNIPEAPSAGAVTASLQPEEDIPDWLREAGWQPAADEIATQESISQLQQAEGIVESQDHIAEAEIPDWLQAMKPPQEAAAGPAPTEEDLSPWLDKLIPTESAEGEEPAPEVIPEAEGEKRGVPDWLIAAGMAGAAVAAVKSDEEEEAEVIETSPDEEQPEWLRAAAVGSAASVAFDEESEGDLTKDDQILADVNLEQEIIEEQAGPVEAFSEDLPSWLKDSGPIPAEDESLEAEMAKDLPDWIIGAEKTEEFEPEPLDESIFSTEFSGNEMPDWLLEAVQEEGPISEIQPETAAPLEEQLAGQAPDWLLETQAEPLETGVSPISEGITAGDEIDIELPDWLMETQSPLEQLDAQALDAQIFTPDQSAKPEIEAGIPAWLLASQLVREEGPTEAIEPEQQIPGWLNEMDATVAGEGEAHEEEKMEEPSDIEVPDWLMESYEEPVRSEALEDSSTEIPSWLMDTQEVKPILDSKAVPATAEVPETGEEIPDWLSGIEEEKLAEAVPAEDLPDWLVEMKQPEPPMTAETPAIQVEAGLEEPVQVSEAHEIEPKPPKEDSLDEAFAWLMGLHVAKEVGKSLETEEVVELPEEAPPTVPVGKLEEAVQVEGEEISIAEPISLEEPVSEKPPSVLDEELVDQDAAFAWLESLAVKQGASEALLLTPEERTESMPEWVKQDALAAEAEKEAKAIGEEAEALKEELPEVDRTILETEAETDRGSILAAAGAALIVEELFDHEAEEVIPEEKDEVVIEEPLLEVAASEIEALPSESETAALEMEEIPEIWDESVIAEPDLNAIEAAVESKSVTFAETPPLEEEIPELPDWLTETAVSPREELEWAPPPIPQRRYDLNEASLSELERIPGIGFITAQNIVIHRDENGPFKSVDDLAQVAGISPATLDSVRDFLFVTAVEPEIPVIEQIEEEIFVLPQAEEISTELNKAREALTQGNLERALDQYAQLIRSNQELSYIAQDLQEASYRYSEDPNVWQNLGDAYLRLEQVQEALQAYIKAEQLLV